MKSNYNRNNDLAKIHIAKKDLGLDDDTYKAMLWTVARVRSSRDLDEAGRRAVLQHMKSRGFKPHQGPKRAHQGAANFMSKVEALLADMQLPWSYATTMAKHMFGRDKLEWLKPAELEKLMVALIKEQDKRNLLVNVDDLLRTLGKGRDYVEDLIGNKWPKYTRDWTRDTRMLNALVRKLTFMRAEIEEAQDETQDV